MAKNINVKVIVGKDYSQTIQLGPKESKEYQIIFDRDQAEKLGTEFAVSYGLENKSTTVFGEDSNTSIVVKMDIGMLLKSLMIHCMSIMTKVSLRIIPSIMLQI